MNKKKQTKGLKDKLSARHKTMHQPDIMYDFGELNKWHESVLIKDIEIADPFIVSKDEEKTIDNYRVACIEMLYEIYKRGYANKIIKLDKKRYFFPKLRTIQGDIQRAKYLQDELYELRMNYYKYKEVIKRLSKNTKHG